MIGNINYGFGREYLSNWTIKEALREVFQNYIDYGKYTITAKDIDENTIKVIVTNDYKPEKLEFLRIGNSEKNGNEDAIGHHGEGLKMAFLVFLREGYSFKIYNPDLMINARWHNDDMIGETMEIHYQSNIMSDPKLTTGFVTKFECSKDIYEEFINDIINEKDIVYTAYNGTIVDKPKGNIYSGNLFVCNIPNLSNAYNIKPQFLPLDRDRSIPSNFDIEYYTSQINQSYNNSINNSKILAKSNLTTKELEGKDYAYVNSLSDNIVDQFHVRRVGTKNVYINKIDHEPIQNRRITEILDKHPKFLKLKKASHKVIYLAKQRVAEHKSIKTLLNTFKKNYCVSVEMIDDINIIINKLK